MTETDKCWPDTWPSQWLGANPEIYKPALWKPTNEIQIARFRQIYIWPLTLRFDERQVQEHVRTESVRRSRCALRRCWQEIDDFRNHAPKIGTDEVDRIQRFLEFDYFNDYLKPVLFRRPVRDADAATWLFQRKDIEAVEVVLNGGRRFEADLTRCNLLLYRTGLAVLSLEIDFGSDPIVYADRFSPMTLADVLDFIGPAQRCHHMPGDNAVFHWRASKPVKGERASGSFDLAAVEPNIEKHRIVRMARHWQLLLRPLAVTGYEEAPLKGPSWHSALPERIPVMTYISLRNENRSDRDVVWSISRGDWYRLCYADSRGKDPVPYAPHFMSFFEEQACYDRFFPSFATPYATRYMFAPHHFVAVGSGGFFEQDVIHHVRRHYFQLGQQLIAEFASLQLLKDRIRISIGAILDAERFPERSESVAEPELDKSISEVQKVILEFSHLFRFVVMSDQTQGQELMVKWRNVLNLDNLFEELKSDIAIASQFLLAQQQSRQVNIANNLSVMAAIGVVLGLAFAFLGMNIVFDSDTIRQLVSESTKGFWKRVHDQALALGVVVSFFGVFGLWMSQSLLPQERRKIPIIVMGTMIFMGLLSILLSVT